MFTPFTTMINTCLACATICGRLAIYTLACAMVTSHRSTPDSAVVVVVTGGLQTYTIKAERLPVRAIEIAVTHDLPASITFKIIAR